jgi:hypothetical protein
MTATGNRRIGIVIGGIVIGGIVISGIVITSNTSNDVTMITHPICVCR